MSGNRYPNINKVFHKFYDTTPKNILIEMLIDITIQLEGEQNSNEKILNSLRIRKGLLRLAK